MLSVLFAPSFIILATLSRHGQVRPLIAAVSTVVACVASALVNLPIVYRVTRDRILIRNLLMISLLITTLGLVSLGLLDFFTRGLK